MYNRCLSAYVAHQTLTCRVCNETKTEICISLEIRKVWLQNEANYISQYQLVNNEQIIDNNLADVNQKRY